ncbi:MAG: hypothetical protein PVG35_04355 [Desulfobacterales bacterium]|jgi:hypothetical protein
MGLKALYGGRIVIEMAVESIQNPSEFHIGSVWHLMGSDGPSCQGCRPKGDRPGEA